MITRFFTVLLLALLLTPAIAMAKPEVGVVLLAEKEVQVEENGQQVLKKVPAEAVAPGDTLIYTLTYSNKGDEVATEVKFHSPIPEGTTYLDGSATADTAQIFFSIDGGKTYDLAGKLEVVATDADGKQIVRPATARDFNSIRWLIPQLPAGTTGELTYQVQVN